MASKSSQLFVTVKMLAGCRTLDLCQAKAEDLGADSLTLTSEATKTREARTVELPADVVAELRAVAGPVWLWERAAVECLQYRPSPRVLARGATEFSPSSWRWTIQNLFREFNRVHSGARLRPHDLRARAATIVATATQSIDATARAMGMDPQTARIYTDAAKAFDGRAIMKKVADVLRGGQ